MNVWLIQIVEVLQIAPGTQQKGAGLFAKIPGARGHRVTWWVGGFGGFALLWHNSRLDWPIDREYFEALVGV